MGTTFFVMPSAWNNAILLLAKRRALLWDTRREVSCRVSPDFTRVERGALRLSRKYGEQTWQRKHTI